MGNPALGGELLTPTRQELDLLDEEAVRYWMTSEKPDVVVLAAAIVGGIEANRSRPADFLLQNLRIETQVIETAWHTGARRLLFLGSSCIYPKFAAQPIREELLLTVLWSLPMLGMRSPRSPESNSAKHSDCNMALMQSA